VEKAKRLPSRAKTHHCNESSVLSLLKSLRTLGFVESPGHPGRRPKCARSRKNVSKMLHVVAFAPSRSGAETRKFLAKTSFAFRQRQDESETDGKLESTTVRPRATAKRRHASASPYGHVAARAFGSLGDDRTSRHYFFSIDARLAPPAVCHGRNNSVRSHRWS
jgi:hypothetical protein